MVNVSLIIISRGVEILHQITLGIKHLGIGLKNDDSAWYQPQQGGLEAFCDHFGDQFFDHEGDDSALYQPQPGGLEPCLDHFGDQFFDHDGDDSAWYQPQQGG